MPEHTHKHKSDEMSFTEENRKFWNDFAPNYTAEQWQKDLIREITKFIQSNTSWIGLDSTWPAKVLDYACGPGTVTSALSDVAAEFIGIDLSDNMVAAYNARFSGETPERKLNAHARVGNLLSDEDSKVLEAPEFFDFDLAAVGLGFHHFENVELATAKLVERLRPGGILLIIDWLEHERMEGLATHTVAHHGFSENRVKQLFESAGLVEVRMVKMEKEVVIRGSARDPFLARGVKPGKAA